MNEGGRDTFLRVVNMSSLYVKFLKETKQLFFKRSLLLLTFTSMFFFCGRGGGGEWGREEGGGEKSLSKAASNFKLETPIVWNTHPREGL